MTFSEFLSSVPGIILVQGVGFIAMALGSLSFQQKKRSGTLIFQAVASVFWVIQLSLLCAWTGAILNVINIFRGFILAGKEKYKWMGSRFTLLGVLLAFSVSGIISFYLEGPISLIPVAASFIQTFGLWSSDKARLRIICSFGSFFWIAYNCIIGTVAGVLCEFLNIGSILISFLRFKLGGAESANSDSSEGKKEGTENNEE